jgi:ketosteroid isomerase-like protein
MSPQNLELVRRAFEAMTRSPKPDFATVNALYHPEHEFVSIPSRLNGASQRGARGAREWLTALGETWQSYEWDLEEVSELDDYRVLLVAVMKARTRHAGLPLEQRLWCVVTVREGKLTRTETHLSRQEALNAVGEGR